MDQLLVELDQCEESVEISDKLEGSSIKSARCPSLLSSAEFKSDPDGDGTGVFLRIGALLLAFPFAPIGEKYRPGPTS